MAVQAVISFRTASTATATKDAVDKATQAVDKAGSAAKRILAATDSVEGAIAMQRRTVQGLREQHGLTTDALRDAEQITGDAKAQASDAQTKAEEAKEDLKSIGHTVASRLSERIPLGVAGIVLVVLGALVNGYLDLAFAADAGGGTTP